MCNNSHSIIKTTAGRACSQPVVPVEDIVRLGVQQDVQVHAPADHLGGSLHQAAAPTKAKRVQLVGLQAAREHFRIPRSISCVLFSHLNTFGTPSRLRSSPSLPSRASTPFKISLGSTCPAAIPGTRTQNS